jgi:hypothetical protein
MNNGLRRAATTHDDPIPLLRTGRHRAILSARRIAMGEEPDYRWHVPVLSAAVLRSYSTPFGIGR